MIKKVATAIAITVMLSGCAGLFWDLKLCLSNSSGCEQPKAEEAKE